MGFNVNEDNQGPIFFAKSPLSSCSSKHSDVRYHSLRKLTVSGDLSVHYIRSKEKHADILTKAIGTEVPERHRGFLLGRGSVSFRLGHLLIVKWFESR